jgi:hypothetical protein
MRCTHTHGRALCFECFRTGVERTRARREAWAQRSLPFETCPPERPLSDQAVAHRRRMLEYLVSTESRVAVGGRTRGV